MEMGVTRRWSPWGGHSRSSPKLRWFSEDVSGADPTDVQTALKFRADWSYRQKNFLKAFNEYSSCYKLLPASNNAMRRDVQESQARCLIHMGRYTEALEISDILMKGVNNTDHLTGVLNLQVTIHNHLGNFQGVVSCLQQLISLHSYNPHYWILLAESYKKLYIASSCRSASLGCHELSVGEALCVNSSVSAVDTSHPGDDTVMERHFHEIETGPSTSEDCRKQLWMWSCASYIRARILLQFIKSQHASFVLDHNRKTQDYIEEQLHQIGLTEESKTLITNVMSEDLLADRIPEEGQTDAKTTQTLSSFVMPTAAEFKEKWFQKIRVLLSIHK
ncbi:uncharacterized protein C8orf76 homolog isoform X2 [Hyperolius riggenbachi]|uniref:uncharacterized protein C8orf76 homolog isoform X2 n=1 Tax=Hyperolius riggenbachi TaxID=752182 RepID=UPI0035A2D8A4